MNPGSDMSCADASSVTGRLPDSSDARTLRRVRSASAAKMPSSCSSEYLTIRFSIGPPPAPVKRPPPDYALGQARIAALTVAARLLALAPSRACTAMPWRTVA